MRGITRPLVGQKFGLDLPISSPYSIRSKEARRSLNEKYASEEKKRQVIKSKQRREIRKKKIYVSFSQCPPSPGMWISPSMAGVTQYNNSRQTLPSTLLSLQCLPPTSKTCHPLHPHPPPHLGSFSSLPVKLWVHLTLSSLHLSLQGSHQTQAILF